MPKFKTKASVFYDSALYPAGDEVEMPLELAQPLLDNQLLEVVAPPKPATEPKAKKES